MSDNNLPLVSVITPCYNDGLYIRETVDSVRKSTYPNIEHIIINDGSTDTLTLQVLEQLRDDDRLIIIDTPNQGVCKARNQAIRASRGKYILPVDGDDLISDTYIEKAVGKLEANPNTKVVCCNYKYFGRASREVFVEDFEMTNLLAYNLYVISSMFRREDFDEIDGFSQNMKDGLEDWEFWIRLLGRGGGVERADDQIHFFYRIKPRQLSRNSSISVRNTDKLRRAIWENNKECFSRYYLDPKKTFEYSTIIESKEYRVGKLILSPVRQLNKSLSRLVSWWITWARC